jgi:hypothetical protein
VLGLDGLSSAAYGPEAALAILMSFSVAGLHYIGAITIAILLLLAILYVSYRQTIGAYPNGGGRTSSRRESRDEGGLVAARAYTSCSTNARGPV